jgi:GntR family transcriptional regulator / MocR family aminotransferase
MAKRAAALDLTLPPGGSKAPAYRWLYSVLRAAILEGRLRPGARIPATRDLARQYRLSRGTIVAAFEQLKSEGYVEGSIGSGTFVSRILPEDLLQVAGKDGSKEPAPPKQRRILSRFGRRVKLFQGYELRPNRAFRANLPAVDLFPTALWAQIASRRWRCASIYDLIGCDSMGYRPLRESLAEYLRASRGVNCTPEQIMITSGVQEALDLVTRLFLDPGDRVCMENPGYVGAPLAFESVSARIIAMPLDNEGMVLSEANLRGSRLIYVTPGHQFPLGVTMSLPRRFALLEAARNAGALIFEDDYDSEFRYSGRPVPALQGLDRNGVVLFAGSFSKILFPSLRLGYLVIPPDLIAHFSAMKSVTSRHAPLLDQAVLCDFIVEGHFGRHLRRMRQVYAERLAVLLESARESLSGLLEISKIEAGLQTVGWLPRGIDGESAARAAAKRNVDVTPLSCYTRGRAAREGLQLGFAALEPREIRRGAKDLATALEATA